MMTLSDGTKVLNQNDRVYRLLNGAMSPASIPAIAKTLGMPLPSVRRCLSELKELGLKVEKTPLGYIIH